MKYLKVILLFGFTLMLSFLHSQSSLGVDTVKLSAIPVEEIPSSSLRVLSKLYQIEKSIISKEIIAAEKVVSDTILSDVESFLFDDENLDFNSLLSRNLVNKSKFWKRKKEVIEEHVNLTEKMVNELASKSRIVKRELWIWRNTRAITDSLIGDSLFSQAVDEVIFKAEGLQKTILDRTTVSFAILKNLKQSNDRVERVLEKIRNISKLRQEQLFEKTQGSFAEIEFDNSADWEMLTYFKLFKDENIAILWRYYQYNKLRIIFFSVYLLGLIIIFLFLLRKTNNIDKNQSGIYVRSTIRILRRPISLALIIAIFSSSLFLGERPPILIDLSILILLFPILDIVMHVAKGGGRAYLVAFSLLIFLRFMNYIFPPSIPVHRLVLLLMGTVELVLLFLLYRKINIREITSNVFNHFAKIVIVIHIAAAIVGLIASLTGYIRLAEIAIDLAITNTLVGLLLIIFTVVVIGLIQLALDGKYLNKFNFVRKRTQFFKNRVVFILMLAVSILWINYILQILRVNDVFYQSVFTILNTKVSLGSVSLSLAGVLIFFFIIWLSIVISDMIKAILDDDVLNRLTLKKGVGRMISVIIRFSLISIGILFAVSAIGMPLTQLTIIISAFSVGIGFGLQNVVNNFVSGVILLFERPVQIDDTVEVNNLIGRVKSMGIRSSNIRTFDGAEVIVPNANLISNEVINWTLSDQRRRIEIFSGVAYGSNVYKVKDILLDVLNSHPDILKEPEPLVLFNDLGESSLDFRLLFWTDNFDRWIIIKSEVVFGIHDALYKANITIPFPQRDVHINYLNDEKDKKDKKDE
jgi:potassium efflux system protein